MPASAKPRIEPTRDIPPEFTYKIPETLEELLTTSGSVMGHSAVSGYLSCPERSRLNALGVRRRPAENGYDGPLVLDDMEYGTLMHALLAIRKVHGNAVAFEWLYKLEIAQETRDKAFQLGRMYDYTFPMPEAIITLGLELEVFTEIGDGRGGSLVRSVRYDEVITRLSESGAPEVFSLERKTMRALTRNVLDPYMPQFMTQVALWNLNPHLVEKYGPMQGVIGDALVKTQVPKVDRLGPIYINPIQVSRIAEYLRLPEEVKYPMNADGSFPRMLHTCWGRWRPCQYIGICHYGEFDSYYIPEKGTATRHHISDEMVATGD